MKNAPLFKRLLAATALLLSNLCFAATDVNQASVADLDAIKGIGPELSGKILQERNKGNFKDWSDLMARVKGIRASNAAKFSRQGMTVDGTAFTTATPK
ncbi:MAG: ComEA family DNA-binding protein [Burkholderiaceae bacterium]